MTTTHRDIPRRCRRPRSGTRRFLPRVERLEDIVLPASFMVTSTADSGAGTLRQAILDDNANPGTNAIAFDIPGSGVHTIQPASALPPIEEPVLLDGTTQPGFAGSPLIELDGSQAGSGVSGLTVLSYNTTVQGLVIDRFSGHGILMYATRNDVIQGNYIGTDPTGTVAEGNVQGGILIYDGAQSNRIGTDGNGNAAAKRNVISGNGSDGVQLYGAAADGTPTSRNLVAGNFIGTDVTGTAPLGNAHSGVAIYGGAQDNAIGGSPALANAIAYNLLQGVVLYDATTTGNSIRANSIHDNGLLGIDLGGDGVTLNHAGSAEPGPNNLQSFPLIQTATPGTSTAVQGTLNGAASTIFTLDFYASTQPNLAHFGDGQRWLGAATVITDATGNAAFNLTLTAATSTGDWLTATATDPGGDTSEFSPAYQLPAVPRTLSATAWTSIGPSPVALQSSTTSVGAINSGRVNVAAADPTNPNVMYVGTDDGGVWKTSDWLEPSPAWTPLTDFQPSLVIHEHGLAVYPGNSQIVYAAASGPGGGILKTTDGGATWSFLANSVFDQDPLNALVVSPKDPDVVYVADDAIFSNDGGLWRSTDGGSTWTNFTRAIHPGPVSDVVMDPTNAAVLYAGFTNSTNPATNGIWKTTDGGSTWTQLTGSVPFGSAVGGDLIRLAVAPSDPQTVYATIFTQPQKDGNLPVFWKTTDGGTAWSPLTTPPTVDWRIGHALLGVDPGNPQTVYVNGDDSPLYQSTDGGATWNQIFATDCVMAHFDDTGALAVVADQGIYRWPGGTAPFAPKGGNLQLELFYNLAPDPNNPNVVFGVVQDQFAALKSLGTLAWADTPGGTELGKVLVDPTNSNVVYDYDTFGRYFIRSDDGGATWQQKINGLDTSGYTDFFADQAVQYAFVMDPADPSRLLVSDKQVFETTNRAEQWTAISPVLSPGFVIDALAVAPSPARTVYAATSDGRLFVTPDDGASGWQERDQGLPRSIVLAIRVDPANAQRALVLISGSGLWMTTNGGGSWSNLSGGNIPPTWSFSPLAVDWRFATPVLYVGTVQGVYRSLDLGQTWAHFGQALPNTTVSDLELVPRLNLLAAATWGRGTWEILVPGPVARFSVTAPTGAVAGTPFTVTVQALDASGNVSTAYTGTVHFTSSDGQAVLPADYTFTSTDNGTHAFTVTLKTAGTRTLTVADTQYSSSGGSATVAVTPAAASHLGVAAPAGSTAGSAFGVTVTALDPYGNTDPTYRGTVQFGSDDPQATLPMNYTFLAADAGAHTFAGAVTLRTAGSRTISATDTVTAAVTGSASVNVSAAAATHLGLTAPAGATAGAAFDVTVAALDPYGNPDPAYRGTVSFGSTDPGATLPAPYSFSGGDNGTHTFVGGVTLVTAGSRTVTAVSTGFSQVSAPVAVSAALASHFTITAPSGVNAGTSFDVTLAALDSYGNPDTNYQGTVLFGSDDAQATLPAPYTFTTGPGGDDGSHTFGSGVTLRTAGNRTVRAADSGNPAVDGNATVAVLPLAATHLGLTVPATATAGAAFDVTVAALDPFGNTDPAYSGTVRLGSDDPQAALPAGYAFTAADAGQHTFASAVTLRTAGVRILSAADTASLQGSTHVLVSAAAASHLGLAVPGGVTAGSPFAVTVSALDPFGNVDPTYRGTVQLGSDDARATLPAAYTFHTGDAGSHAFAGVLLLTAGGRTLSARDSASLTGSVSAPVSPAAASRLVVSAPAGATAGIPFDLAVTAFDPFGNQATNYAGTVALGSDDARAALPVGYAFTPADAGSHTFRGVILRSAGSRTVTAADAGAGLTSAAPVSVSAAAAAVTLSVSPSPAVFGQPVTLTATVRPADPAAGTPGGTVTFLDGSTRLGTALLDGAGQATLVVPDLPAGTHALGADYGGDATFAGAVPAVLDQAITDQPVSDVTGLLSVSLGRFRRRGGHGQQTVTVVNVGGRPLEGPISLVLDGLGRKVRLVGRGGVTAGGSPYLDMMPGPDDLLAPGATLHVTLVLTSPRGGRVHFRLRVLAGVGAR